MDDATVNTANGYSAGDWASFFPTGTTDYFNSLDYTLPNTTSLDHLAGIASLMSNSPQLGRPSPPEQGKSPQIALLEEAKIGSPPESSSQSQSRSVVYLSWPANLPDMVTTRHLYVSMRSLLFYIILTE